MSRRTSQWLIGMVLIACALGPWRPAPAQTPAPPIEEDILLRAARNAMSRKDLKSALERFEALLARAPDEAAGRTEYAGALAQAGRLKDAAAQYETLLKRFPERSELHEQAADVYLTMKDFGRARAQLEQVLSVKKGDLAVQLKLANLIFWSGDQTAALARYQKLLDASFDQPAAWAGYMSAAAAQKEISAANVRLILKLAGAMSRRPGKDVPALMQLASLLRRIKELPRSVEILEIVVAMNPEDRKARLQLADTAHEMGEFKKAEGHYKLLVEGLPGGLK